MNVDQRIFEGLVRVLWHIEERVEVIKLMDMVTDMGILPIESDGNRHARIHRVIHEAKERLGYESYDPPLVKELLYQIKPHNLVYDRMSLPHPSVRRVSRGERTIPSSAYNKMFAVP